MHIVIWGPTPTGSGSAITTSQSSSIWSGDDVPSEGAIPIIAPTARNDTLRQNRVEKRFIILCSSSHQKVMLSRTGKLPGEIEPDLASLGPRLGAASDRGRVVHVAWLNDHILRVALEIDAHDPARLKRDHAIPGVVTVLTVEVIDRNSDRLADDGLELRLELRADPGVAAEGDRGGALRRVELDGAV